MALSSRLFWWVVSHLHQVLATYTLTIFTGTLLAVLLLQKVREARRLPPGPLGLPFLGILPFIKKDFHLLLTDYAARFGSLFSVRMGSQLVVVLSDHKLIKKAFAKEEFASRPKTELGSMLGGYGKLIIFLLRIKSISFFVL